MFQLNWYYFGSLIFVFWVLHHFKAASVNQGKMFLKRLAQINIFFYVYNLYFFTKIAHVLTLLPLQLCNLGVILIPIALRSHSQKLWDFLVYACSLGALAAILIVNKEYHDTYSLFTLSFYLFHFLIFIIPILAYLWGEFTLHPNLKTAFSITQTLIIVSLLIHGINLALNSFGVPANYFFTIRKYSTEVNPVFAGFAAFIPIDYFYMYLVFPIMYAYMGLMHLILNHRHH